MSIRPTLTASGPQREALREKGQFWTPTWVAEAMVAWVAGNGAETIFDPAVGAGAFFQAAKAVAPLLGRKLALRGTEIDAGALDEARRHGLSEADLCGVELRDFALDPPPKKFAALVANPPYIRHHRLPGATKEKLRHFGAALTGQALDGRAGYHVYFLLRGLQMLAPDGRLSFIMPADTCEGVFAPSLWAWIARRYRLCAVLTFAPAATPFPGVDTNAVVFFLENKAPRDSLMWACCAADTAPLTAWAQADFIGAPGPGLAAVTRPLAEALRTGLSRPPRGEICGPTLGDFATVRRGVATGANEFFLLTAVQAKALGLPESSLVPAIGRTRDVTGEAITPETLCRLEALGRPTWLLALDGQDAAMLPAAVRNYLRRGEALGLPGRPLLSKRRPWYKMETRVAPPILFAYLGRRNVRFVRNLAGVVPLTGFLCVYPRRDDAAFIEALWQALRRPETLENLRLVGKSYGGGAIKVEPRALERLPLEKF